MAYSNIARSEAYQHGLLHFVAREYGLAAVDLTPAKRGYYGETWRLNTVDASYFLKLVYPAAHRHIYESSFPIIQHLCDYGINFISQIVKDKAGHLFTRFDGAILGVFGWIDGEHVETDATKIPEYQMLAKVYTVPADGLSIPREDFSGDNAARFFSQWETLQNRDLLMLLEKNRTKINHRASRLAHFAKQCRGDTADFFITHGDAGGNLIKNGDNYYLVDWDNPVLAPPERDAWCMCNRDWAREAFHNALRQNGIGHSLRLNRLAYYCYSFFFFYLSAYLDGFTQGDTVQEVEAYIDGWIEESIAYADGVV